MIFKFVQASKWCSTFDHVATPMCLSSDPVTRRQRGERAGHRGSSNGTNNAPDVPYGQPCKPMTNVWSWGHQGCTTTCANDPMDMIPLHVHVTGNNLVPCQSGKTPLRNLCPCRGKPRIGTSTPPPPGGVTVEPALMHNGMDTWHGRHSIRSFRCALGVEGPVNHSSPPPHMILPV